MPPRPPQSHTDKTNAEWYRDLSKPRWAIPHDVFPFAWGLIYPMVLMVFACMALCLNTGHMPVSLGIPVGANLIANVGFRPLQRRSRTHTLPLMALLVMLITIPWIMSLAWPVAPWGSLFLVPYLLWICYVTALQVSIAWQNPVGSRIRA